MLRRNEIGNVYGVLTVLASAGTSRDGQARWMCRCACGKTHEASGGHLRGGGVTSCGCQKPRLCAAAATKHGDTAAGKLTPEYRAWSNMIERCGRPGNKSYLDYGHRGIAVCSEWRASFAAFLSHVGRRPGHEYSIDRIDNDRGYEPGNVRWALRSEQNRNKRSNVKLTLDGVTLCLAEWARRRGIGYATLCARVKAGWSVERALDTPTRPMRI